MRPGWLALLAATLLGWAAVPAPRRIVFAALAAAVWIAVLFFVHLARRNKEVPVDEIGTWYVALVTLYTVIPLLVYLIVGGEYSFLSDVRLFLLQPSPRSVARVALYYNLYLAVFAAVYLWTRARSYAAIDFAAPGNTRTFVIIGLWMASVALIPLVLPRLTGTSGYAEAYAQIGALPLAVRQVFRLHQGTQFVLTVALVIVVFSNFRRLWWILPIWLTNLAYLTVRGGGARASLMVSLAASMVLYHRYVRPFTWRRAMLIGTAGVVLFLGLGVLRTYRQIQSAGGVGAVSPTSVSGGEFEALFANAVDLEERVRLSGSAGAPPQRYASEVFAAVPSQLLPFPKIDLADWYAATYYPEARELGHGFAFGVIAQSLVGYGLLELVLRAALLGFIFARLHGFYRRNSGSFWVTVFYVWLIVWTYNSFRNTSLSFLSSAIQQFLPTLLVVETASFLLKRGSEDLGRGLPALRPDAPAA